jgi:hypothetical protein
MTHKRPGRRAKAERQRRLTERSPADKLLEEMLTGTTKRGKHHGKGKSRTQADQPQGDTDTD